MRHRWSVKFLSIHHLNISVRDYDKNNFYHFVSDYVKYLGTPWHNLNDIKYSIGYLVKVNLSTGPKTVLKFATKLGK
jgi:hypothetical protein